MRYISFPNITGVKIMSVPFCGSFYFSFAFYFRGGAVRAASGRMNS